MSERLDGLPKAPRRDGERRRWQIISAVERIPGVSLRALAREIGAAGSTVEYQVGKLVSSGALIRRAGRGKHEFFASRAAVLNHNPGRHPVQERVLALMKPGESYTQHELVDLLGDVPRQTLAFHLHELQTEGQLGSVKRGRCTLYNLR